MGVRYKKGSTDAAGEIIIKVIYEVFNYMLIVQFKGNQPPASCTVLAVKSHIAWLILS